MQATEELSFVDGGSVEQFASPEFRWETVANDQDMDEQGHVSNVVFVRWVQDAARAHSAAIGYDLDTYVRIGSTFVVRKHEISYLLPAYAGDRVALLTRVAWWRSAISERLTRVLRVSDDKELARASTLWAYVSVTSGRLRRIPPEVRQAFSSLPPGA